MKQRTRVVGIIKSEDQILLLKRSQDRSDNSPVWELPTGKIELGEQPEEAMSRTILEYTGTYAKLIKLKDAITFLVPEDAGQLSNLYIVYEITISEKAQIVPRDRYSAYKYLKYSEISTLNVSETSRMTLDIVFGGHLAPENIRHLAYAATVYVDGCSRGNPGPSGIGFYIIDENGNVLKKGGDFIGFASSRVAEYHALKQGIKQAIALNLKSVRFISDNLMMVNQMNGIYQIKNRDLIPIYKEIQELLGFFDSCAFIHVKREQNTRADQEANLAVDRHLN